MSTNARIGIERPLLNAVESIYTHWDGYPSHHGPLLLGYYNDWASVEELISFGDLSVLGAEIGHQHDFDTRHDDPATRNFCKFYARDRGEEGVGPKIHPPAEWPDSGQEYEYLYKIGRAHV